MSEQSSFGSPAVGSEMRQASGATDVIFFFFTLYFRSSWMECLTISGVVIGTAIALLPVLWAIVCHLPQLVLFHFITVSAANSRNDRDGNCLSEPLSWKRAHHTWNTSELARSVVSLVAEMVLDTSDQMIADNSQRT